MPREGDGTGGVCLAGYAGHLPRRGRGRCPAVVPQRVMTTVEMLRAGTETVTWFPLTLVVCAARLEYRDVMVCRADSTPSGACTTAPFTALLVRLRMTSVILPSPW